MVVSATSELMRSTGLRETEQDFAGRFPCFRDDSRGHLDGDYRRRQRPVVPGQRHDAPAGVFLGYARMPGHPFRQLGADHAVDGGAELRKSAGLSQRGDVVQLRVTGHGPGHRSGAGDASQEHHGLLPGHSPRRAIGAVILSVVVVQSPGQFLLQLLQVADQFNTRHQSLFLRRGYQLHPDDLPHI